MENTPTQTYRITDYLLSIMVWRNNLGEFFRAMTGFPPRPFQEDFFEEIQGLKSKNLVVVAGRGIGKTIALATVALWYTMVLSVTEGRPMKVTILAGSLDQARICYNYIMEFINATPYLQQSLSKEPTQKEVLFSDGSWIRPLPASEKSIRGHHPDLLIIDEAAQVEDQILFAALPMTATSPYARHIYSTTPSTGYSFIEDHWEHQKKFTYPNWRFFNWDAESFLEASQIEILKETMPEDLYRSEIKGLPYRREGKVFRLADLKECRMSNIKESLEGEKYAGIDWGYYPAPTVIIITQRVDEDWFVLYSKPFLKEYSGDVIKELHQTCLTYNVTGVFTDSTDKGENLRLAATGLPIQPVPFKSEKSTMLANLRILVEQHRIKFDPLTQQPLIGQLIDYTYDSKRNDDFVDALMLAVKPNPIIRWTSNISDILKAAITPKGSLTLGQDQARKRQIRARLEEIGRKNYVKRK